MKKRFLSILMALSLALSLLPTAAFATEGTGGPGSEVVQGVKENYISIAAALEAGETNVTLVGDLTENVVIPAGKTLTIDLGGRKITNDTTSTTEDTIYVTLGAELTINGTGTVDNVSNAKAAIFNNGTVTLNGGTYTRSQETGRNPTDGGENSYYNILNHGIMTINKNVEVTQTGAYSSLIANGYYNYMATNERSGYVEGTNQAAPSLTINGGTFSGGINTIKNDDNATLVIYDGLITNVTQAAVQNNNIATIYGGTFNAPGYDVLQNRHFDSAYNAGKLTVSGGEFTGSLLNTSGAVWDITGGTFSDANVRDYVSENHECIDNNNGTYTVRLIEDKLVIDGSVGEDGNVTGSLDGKFDPNGTTVTDETDDGVSGSGNTTGVTDNVEVKLTTTGRNATTTTLNVTQATAKSLEEANSLTVQTDAGNVSFNDKALDKIAAATSSVVITVEKAVTAPTGTLASYTVTAEDTSGNLLPYGGDKDVTVTVTVKLPDGKTSAEEVQAWYVTDNSGSLSYVESLSVANSTTTGYVDVTIGHLSTIVLRDASDTVTGDAAAVLNADGTVKQSYATLQAAIDAADPGETVQLLRNVTLTKGVDVSKQLRLDLAGHTIRDGEVWTEATSDYLVAVKRGGDLTIDDSKGTGAIIAGQKTVACGVKMTVKDEEPTGDPAKLTVNGGTIQGYYYGIAGNGSRHNTEITINSGLVQDGGNGGTAIYHPQDGTLTVTGGTIQSTNTAIEIRSGSLNVTDGKITGGKGTPAVTDNGSGTTTRNAGIAIAQHTTKKPITVNITGGTITGGAAVYESNPQGNEGSEQNEVSVSIANATLSGNLMSSGFGDISVENTKITGNVTKGSGSMSLVNSTISGKIPDSDSGIVVVNCKDSNGDPINVVPEGTDPFLVNGQGYDTLSEALGAISGTGTIVLTKDTEERSANFIITNKSVTITGTGTLTVIPAAGETTKAFDLRDGGNLTLDGNVNVTIHGTPNADTSKGNDGTAFAMYTTSTLTIQGNATLNMKNLESGMVFPGSTTPVQGAVTVDGATLTASNIDGNFSNGGQFTFKNGATGTITGCGSHGLSANTVTVDTNSKLTVSDCDLRGISINDAGGKLEIRSGGVVNVTNAGTDTSYTNNRYAVYLNPNATGGLTVAEGGTLNVTAGTSGNNRIMLEDEVTDSSKLEGTIIGNVILPDDSNKHIITYTSNGSTLSMVVVENSVTLPAAPAAPSAYHTFQSWRGSDGKTYGAQATVNSITSDMTFDAQWSYNPPSTDNGGSGGSSEPSYSPVIDITGNGTIKVSPRTPSEGDEVTITPDPDNGYEVGSVTVTDRSGRTVRVTENRNGTYTFTQPAGRVTIEVTFVRTGENTFFTDVPETFWAYDEIAWAYENGYVNGVTATTFNPNGAISRQQVWMILARLSGYDPADMAAARAWAMENGVSDGTNPGNAVTRQQLVALLFRFAELRNYANDQRADLSVYPDAGTVAEYAVEPMQWSVANDIVGGTTAGTLNPEGTATRAQFAVILYRFWTNV